jgi:hypothetical protein
MATNEVNIKVKVDSKEAEQAAGRTESLRKEIRRLTDELGKVDRGSKEFATLSEQLKDARDELAITNARSRDLLDSFSMIPGPVGQIGSSISSTSDKLKIFSSFKLTDVKAQFKAFKDDIGLVANNVGRATGITKLYETTVGGLSKVFKMFGASANVASKAAGGFGKALIATGIGAIVIAVGALIANFDSFKKVVLNLIPGLGKVADFIGGLVNKFTDLIGVTSEAERAEERRQATYARAKGVTDIVNQGLEREIKLLQASGASQDDIDKKRKQQIAGQLKDLINAKNERGQLFGEQATQYKDLQNELLVIDAAAKKRQQDATDATNKENKSKRDAANKQSIQDRKAYLQSQADAEVQLLKDSSDTNETELRAALKKQFDLRNEGKKLSTEVQKQQAAEIDRIVTEELAKDKEQRKKTFDDRIKTSQEAGKIELDALDVELEAKKLKYGEDSVEFRNAQQAKFDKQKEILNNEEAILKEKEATKDGLTNDEINRQKAIKNERGALLNAIKATNDAQVESDLEKALKTAEAKKKETDDLFAENMRKAEGDLAAQQSLLDAKKKLDEQYYTEQLAREGLTADQIKAIKEKQTADAKANAEAQISIEQKKFDNQQKLLGATAAAVNALADIVGKNTAAGKALAVAASLINTYAAIAGQLKAATASPGAAIPGYAIAQAVATGLVGFKAVADIIKTPVPSGGSTSTGTPEKPRALWTGGMISGRGSGRSDMVPAMLSNGESVINAQSTAMFRPLLSSINAIGGGKRFADGGMAIGSFSQDQALKDLQNSLVSNQPPIRTYVVSSDMTNQQMMDRAIKDRSTL